MCVWYTATRCHQGCMKWQQHSEGKGHALWDIGTDMLVKCGACWGHMPCCLSPAVLMDTGLRIPAHWDSLCSARRYSPFLMQSQCLPSFPQSLSRKTFHRGRDKRWCAIAAPDLFTAPGTAQLRPARLLIIDTFLGSPGSGWCGLWFGMWFVS